LPGNVIPAEFDGVVARLDPPLHRPLSVYTRVKPDPITAAFVEAIPDETLAAPARRDPVADLNHHERLRPP
jgi:hypothetical protein